MIVVEGPDGAGKTTLIEELMSRFDFDLQQRVVGSDTKAMTDLKAWVEHDNWKKAWVEGAMIPLYDRHRLISEFIYGPIVGRAPEPGFDNFEWVNRELHSFYIKHPLIIYCLPPIEVVRENAQREDTDNSAVAHRIDGIWVAYSRFAARDIITADAMVWDYTQMDLDWFISRLREEYRGRYPRSY